MNAAYRIAAQELNASLALDDKPLLTYLHSIDLRTAVGDKAGGRKLLDRAIAIDPRTFIVREKYMGALQTRWGGSVEEMRAFLNECRRAGLSAAHLRILEGLVVEDEAWTLRYRKGDTRAAVRAYLKAAQLNPLRSCIQCGPIAQAADTLLADKSYKEAIKLYSEVLSHNPSDTYALSNRAFAEEQLNQWNAAFADFLRAAELGDAYSQDAVARLYLVGTSVPHDRGKAIDWLRKSAAQGYAPAKELLPVALDKSKEILPQP
jgi:TPR repeat protein